MGPLADASPRLTSVSPIAPPPGAGSLPRTPLAQSLGPGYGKGYGYGDRYGNSDVSFHQRRAGA